MTKRELVLRAIRGEDVPRVPVGFWFHFVTLEEKGQGLNNPRIFQKSLEGHRRYVEEGRPDFVKIMSDGFFKYPSDLVPENIYSVSDFDALQSIGENHPWIEQQIEIVQAILASFPEDLASFYNIFAPASYLKRWFRSQHGRGDKELADFLLENPVKLKAALEVIAGDIAILVKRLLEETDLDGIYFSTQAVQDERVSAIDYQKVIEPSNLVVLEAANEVGGNNILHICGFEGASNDLALFSHYPAQVFNWATHHENVSLEEGRQLFHGKTVLGGFENTQSSLLNTGNREELVQETKHLISKAGSRNLILGADCTVPDDFQLERLEWIRQAAIL
ncbi:hypothetical protein STRDD10_01235 [Streptococcus sp. DD10]|uniref:uroporphyrinogen decarboxylase family protein n=1 Tax=Streptococcus sp. DD10 TaxID=1777878 RepID=UPI00079A1F8C|nr:uroporphyrinogen decarboxylase family protein [Streptococcus sp. DD10]KXT74077.1 hypothetical protein STRDD10_01235 [Streptococcus sp. DD10]